MAKADFKAFRYYEGICSSSDLVKELSKVLTLGVKSEEIKDNDGNILQEPIILKSKNWDIVYPAPDANLEIDWKNLSGKDYKTKILNQVDKISDTVILKTTTTPKKLSNNEIDEFTVDGDDNKESLTMYLEIYKPTYIADPETYPLDCERQGIIPKLTTKEMYQKSYETSIEVEEVISNISNSCCTVNTSTTEYEGIVTLDANDCALYVSKITNIYGNTATDAGFYVPTVDGTSTNKISLDNAKIAKIKQKDNDLYTLICSTLSGNIDDKTYLQLTNISFYVTKDGSSYYLSMVATRSYNIYTISGNYQLSNNPIDITTVHPEYYIDGIYIPLAEEYYTTSTGAKGSLITFNKTITAETSENGNLVVRYQTAKTEGSAITERKTLLNNHYLLMRLFDNLNEDGDAPAENTINEDGETTAINAHVSDWTKLSWYKDFEEVFVDELDTDIEIANVSDGVVHVPLETVGLNSETKIRYWINTNNDRFNLVVMGNPSLDYETDRHLISACYCGKIDSFDNSINDVAGNFALFSSSSTEPCATTLEVEKTQYTMDYTSNIYSGADFDNFLDECYSCQCVSDTKQYYVTINADRHFNTAKWPKYIIMQNGNPITDLLTVHQVNYVSDNQAVITIHSSYDESYTLYIAYPYYEEKYVITSGVTRDVFGNVMQVNKTTKFGSNTSDGTTSVMMYHTRSKAYFQKHHMMFTTTEEYMSKAMYGKSSYTNEYYADRIKITHGNDGPRGMLNDMLVIDSESLFPLDELVINKDFEKDPNEFEETYVYFPVTAPYSPLSDSPNARYGIAIKKAEVEPSYSDEEKILSVAIDELQLLANESWWGITNNIYPLEKTSNGCKVFWEAVPDSDWYETEGNSIDYEPIKLAIVATSEYKGDTTPDGKLTSQLIKLEPSGKIATTTESSIKIATGTTFTLGSGEVLYYGISDTDITSIGNGAQIRIHMVDESENPEGFDYFVDGLPYIKELGTFKIGDTLNLVDADPSKYLVVYSVDKTTTEGKYFVRGYACAPLKDDVNDNHLLSYPCNVSTYITSGVGTLISDASKIIPYGSSMNIGINPKEGWELTSVIVNGTTVSVSTVQINGESYPGVVLDNIEEDTVVKLSLTKVED